MVLLRGLPRQRGPLLRLHLTPALLGRALRELAPDFAPEFPRLQPLEAALVVFYLHVLAAVEKSGPGDGNIVLFPPEAGIPISVPRTEALVLATSNTCGPRGDQPWAASEGGHRAGAD